MAPTNVMMMENNYTDTRTSATPALAVTSAEFARYVGIPAVGDMDDDQIADINRSLTMATDYVERMTSRCMMTQTRQLRLDAITPNSLARAQAYIAYGIPVSSGVFAAEDITIPSVPVVSISSIVYYTSDNTETTFATASYRLDALREPPRVLINAGYSWPSGMRNEDSLVVEYVAGYTAASAVPPGLKVAILRAAAGEYESREIAEDDAMLKRAIEPFRIYL